MSRRRAENSDSDNLSGISMDNSGIINLIQIRQNQDQQEEQELIKM